MDSVRNNKQSQRCFGFESLNSENKKKENKSRMKYPEKIDLHMHSTASDGTDSPEELIEKVKAAGIELFAVTDHDGIDGANKTGQLLLERKETELQFIKGIEFSCRDEFGKYHILGYAYDSETEELKNVVSVAHNNRVEKVQKRLDFLKEEFGFTFKDEDIKDLFKNANPGKPHIANMMIRYGYAASIQGAMKDYLNKKKFPNAYIRPEVAIQTILKSKGVPVLAHPIYGDGSQMILGDELKDRIERLIDFGLEGLEGYYSGFTPKMISLVTQHAKNYQLYVTAGSDYHGNNKLVQLLDTNLEKTSSGCPELFRFLDRVLV